MDGRGPGDATTPAARPSGVTGCRDRRPYDHVVLAPGLIAAFLVTALLALIPARRLYLSGAQTMVIGAYFGALWLLGLLIALGPGRSRFLVPLLIILYVLPFIRLPASIQRLLGRPSSSAPAGDVTPAPEVEPPSGRW